jgi:hypothetical protein
MICQIILDNVEYNVLYTPKYTVHDGIKKYILLWHPLVVNLWKQLTESQKKKLIIINPYNEKVKVINFNCVLDCFKFKYTDNIIFTLKLIKFHKKGCLEILKGYNYHDNRKAGECTCGIKIAYEYVIKNIETEKYCIIGSECIKWWERINLKELNNLKKIEKNFKEKEKIKRIMPIFCSFCQKENICVNCKKMKNIRIIFYEWYEETRKNYIEGYLLNENRNKNLLIKYLDYNKMGDPEKIYVDVSYKSKELAKHYVNYDADESASI